MLAENITHIKGNGIRRFVIGDIHGCYTTLKILLFEVLKIIPEDNIYFLGDYVDRGPNSKKVLDLLLMLRNYNYQIYPIIGNHEDMMLSYDLSDGNFSLWHRNGGKHTLRSFNVDHPDEIPEYYFDFLSRLPTHYVLEDFIIVHAGLNFENEDIYKDTYSMLNSRDYQYDALKAKGKKLIVGHTPQRIENIKISLKENIIFLDGGCVFVDFDELGNLCALELNSMELFWVKNQEEM
ncbi:metallophosphoesterase family protein [Bacteroidota bacterium]